MRVPSSASASVGRQLSLVAGERIVGFAKSSVFVVVTDADDTQRLPRQRTPATGTRPRLSISSYAVGNRLGGSAIGATSVTTGSRLAIGVSANPLCEVF